MITYTILILFHTDRHPHIGWLQITLWVTIWHNYHDHSSSLCNDGQQNNANSHRLTSEEVCMNIFSKTLPFEKEMMPPLYKDVLSSDAARDNLGTTFRIYHHLCVSWISLFANYISTTNGGNIANCIISHFRYKNLMMFCLNVCFSSILWHELWMEVAQSLLYQYIIKWFLFLD